METPTETPTPSPTIPEPTSEPGAPVLLDRACDVTAFASTDSSRYVLSGVHLAAKCVEATNGHSLIRVPYPTMDAADFPAVRGPATFTPGQILPTAPLQKALRNLPTRTRLPILSCVRVASSEESGSPARLHLTTDDTDTQQTISPKVVEGRYPDINQAIPNDAPTLTIALSPSLLGVICDYAKKHAVGDNPSLRLEFTDETSPMRWSVTLADKRQVLGVLMPMRLS